MCRLTCTNRILCIHGHGVENKWWSSSYVKVKKSKSSARSASYQHYRENIDGMLLHTVVQHCQQAKIRVAELCSGDGSFAFKLLQESGEDLIESYVLLERNVQLINASRKRLARWMSSSDNGAGEKEAASRKDIVKHVNMDVCSEEGEHMLRSLDSHPNVWIASGSVLNGQVGNYYMAASMLGGMAASLHSNRKYNAGAILVVTGYTQTFLTPQMLRESGLKIVQGSLPSSEANGLVSGFGRFHMFVLEKDEGGHREKEDGYLRSIMLGEQ